jgi:putative Mg2+ transporter-C (MgtC) family protein
VEIGKGLAAGIGFLGAGSILKNEPGETVAIRGLTTASSIWVTAAVGMAVGAGSAWPAILATILALVILGVLRRFE